MKIQLQTARYGLPVSIASQNPVAKPMVHRPSQSPRPLWDATVRSNGRVRAATPRPRPAVAPTMPVGAEPAAADAVREPAEHDEGDEEEQRPLGASNTVPDVPGVVAQPAADRLALHGDQGPDQHEHEEEQVAELAGVIVHDGLEPGLYVAVDVLVADALAAAVGAALALAAGEEERHEDEDHHQHRALGLRPAALAHPVVTRGGAGGGCGARR